MTTARLRINPHTGEVEIEGSEDFIRDMWPKVSEQLASAKRRVTEAKAPPAKPEETEDRVDEVEEFGEYLHTFSLNKDTDRALVAGSFVARGSANNVFTTKEANAQLIEQGIKLTNASQCVKNLQTAKRIFKVSGGFRISKDGEAHLKTLRKESESPGT